MEINLPEIEPEGVWRNEGYKEEYEFLKGTGFHCLTVEYIPVKCEFDENYSTSFQLRHVVDSRGNRGFMCYVSKEFIHLKTHRQGTTPEVYAEVLLIGTAMQKEELRRAWINLNRR